MDTPIWREKMKVMASFGGARFYVDSVEYSAGRQTKKHTFANTKSSGSGGAGGGPVSVGKFVDRVLANGVSGTGTASSEVPYFEDLGAAPKQFTVNGYWLESNLEFGMPDYLKARDLFLEKMSEEIERTLILPTFGEVKCKPGKVTTKFSNKEGGIETFSAIFYRASINFQPFFADDTKTALQLESEELTAILVAGMRSTYSVTEAPLSVTSAGIPGIAVIPEGTGLAKFVAEDTVSSLEKFRAKVESFTGYGETKLSELNSYIQKLNGFSNSITELILFPSQLATSMTDIVRQMSNIFIRPIDAFKAQKDLISNFADDFSDILGDTLDALSLQSNVDSIISITKNAAGSEMMRVASEIDFDSAEQAIDVRDEMTEIIEELQLINADVISNSSPYLQMRTVLASSVRDITQRSAVLPIVSHIQLDDSLPLLVVSYGLYEDASRFEEIQTRNGVPNNLIPQTDLEVLSE